MSRSEEIEKIVEEKVQERMEKERKKIRKEVKNELIERLTQNKTEQSKEKISRRSFLKKLGAGAIGLSALTLPGAALDIKDSNLEVFTGSSKDTLQKYLTVNQDGPVEITNTKLQIENNIETTGSTTIWDSGNSEVPGSQIGSHGNTAHSTNYLATNDYTPVTDINNETSMDIDITGDADTIDGYDIQKDGAGGTGVINFITTN